MLINLAFIKSSNGLFYFALDYIAALEDAVDLVLARTPALAAAVRQRFPAIPVRVTMPLQAARIAWSASRRGEMVFTPSPHPIPWCSRQMVVVHDTFPFEGAKGAGKATLFFSAMRTSRAVAGYINQSDARAFLVRGRLDLGRLISSPNRMQGSRAEPLQGGVELGEQLVVGLFGTDSAKKNYDQLFAAIADHAHVSRARFRLYGQANDYASRIIAGFPQFDIQLANSDAIDLETFVRSVDIVASAATREGFSRPMALALSLGIPCWIVDAPVFREFYGETATFHAGVRELGGAIARIAPKRVLPRPIFTLPERIERDFLECIAWLKMQDVHRS